MKIESIIHAAIDAGVLPPAAVPPAGEARLWPVVLLTALGAWLAAVPLIAMVGMLLGDHVQRGTGPYIVAALMLSGAVVVLRSRELPLLVEQLAVPALLVGGGSLGFGVFRDLPDRAASAVLAVTCLGVAWVVARDWLRLLLGALAALLTALALRFDPLALFDMQPKAMYWSAWHFVLGLWLLARSAQRWLLSRTGGAWLATAVEPVQAGWGLAAIAGLAWWSGMTFLVGASLGDRVGTGSGEAAAWGAAASPVMHAVSALLAAAAAAIAARAWPALRQAWCLGVALVVVALAWFMPALGAVLLALSLCVTAQRWRLALAAALAAAWIVGGFYYQLAWPLATKAVVLVGAGAALAALAWWAWRHEGGAHAMDAAAGESPPRRAAVLIAACAAAVLAVANIGIWQKEQLIAHGRPVYVELAPVDPRSLMQGDYMALNFRLPEEVSTKLNSLVTTQRPRIVVRLDARGVAQPLHLDEGQAIGIDELRIELTPKGGRWILVSDAWFFREGDADRWAGARYGEFRVADDGRALLVGMAGQDLKRIAP